jgi:hypothetical protein
MVNAMFISEAERFVEEHSIEIDSNVILNADQRYIVVNGDGTIAYAANLPKGRAKNYSDLAACRLLQGFVSNVSFDYGASVVLVYQDAVFIDTTQLGRVDKLRLFDVTTSTSHYTTASESFKRQ